MNRLDKGELSFQRDQCLNEMKMWLIIREILTYLCFISLLYILIYSNLNSNEFNQVNHLRKLFLNSRQINEDYTKILTIDDYWNWLEKSFVFNIQSQPWYNHGDTPYNLTGYINDKTNRLIGWVKMKQLRIKLHQCQIQQNLILNCKNDFSNSNEEKNSFEPGWINNTTEIYSSSIIQAFKYNNDDGGYIYEFLGQLSDIQSNLSKLHQLEWIDNQTKAVIIQFNLYNANVELFTSITLLVDFLLSGGLYPQSSFQPFSFQVFGSLLQLICSILYLIFLIYLMIQQIQSFIQLKMKYFLQFWCYIDIIIIICSWTSVGIYIWKYKQSKYIDNLINQTNNSIYLNLQISVYINNLLRYLIGFCCFFGTIKSIRFSQYNRRISLFLKTIQHARKNLLSFLMMFLLIFLSFICLFYLLFNSKLLTCSNLFQTIEMLFQMIVMKYNIHDLIDVASFLGPFCFSLFIFIVVFICLSMFISILIDSFRFVRNNANAQYQKDKQILAFIFDRFRCWIGIQNELEKIVEQDEKMRSKYYDPIEQFPDKIDQLLDALNRLYMNQQSHVL